MIDTQQLPSADIEQDPATWSKVWVKRDWEYPIDYGVDARILDGVKQYRAWAIAHLIETTVHSEEFEACDRADVPLNIGFLPMTSFRREQVIREAGAARALMTESQKSPLDMEHLATDIVNDLKQRCSAWQQAEDKRIQQAREDEEYTRQARNLVRGLILLASTGSEHEQIVAKKLLNLR